MKLKLLESYKLRKRLEKLEQLIHEKTVGRGGGDSTPYKVWKYLRDEGPKTRSQIGQQFNSGALKVLPDMVREDCITKQGDLYSYNPDYNWDDVGVLPRTMAQEIARDLNTPTDDISPTVHEEPVRRTRRPRIKEVKQNLFSRKYDEVKAAIDAGQDVNQKNSSGITPIVYACRDTKGQSGLIVELLLEHGANANNFDGNTPIIFNAIENKNLAAIKALAEHGAKLDSLFKGQFPIESALEYLPVSDDAVMDVVITLTDSSIGKSLRTWNSAYKALFDKRLSKEWYNAIINKTYDNNRVIEAFFYRSNILMSELRQGVSTVYDLYEKYSGAMPPINKNSIMHLNDSNTFALNRIFKTIKDVANGKLECGDSKVMLEIYNVISEKLNKTIDNILNFITPEYIEEEAKSDDSTDLFGILTYAIDHNNINIINMIAKAKVSILDCNEIIGYITSNLNRQVTAAALRVAGNCKNIKNGLSDYMLYKIMVGDNSYLIDWAIDNGFGQMMIDLNKSLLYKNDMSNICKNALIEAGFNIRKSTPVEDIRYNNSYKICKRYILRLVGDDEWSMEADNILNKFPELLTDEDILEAIKDNPDSATANQLKRRIDSLPKDDIKYDF